MNLKEKKKNPFRPSHVWNPEPIEVPNPEYKEGDPIESKSVRIPDPDNILRRCEAREIYFNRIANKRIRIKNKIKKRNKKFKSLIVN